MEKYERLEVEVILFDTNDIIEQSIPDTLGPEDE